MEASAGGRPAATCNSAASPDSPALLAIVLRSHNHPYPLFASPTSDHFTPFHLHLEPPTAQIGFIPKHVLQEVLQRGDHRTFVHLDGRIGLARELNTFRKRSDALHSVVLSWRDAGLFKDALDGWREEKYAIYSSDSFPLTSWHRSRGRQQAVFELERAACALFGLVTYGVHLTAYTQDEQGQRPDASGSMPLESARLKVWVPRRSATKATWPNYLDNSVAGGITSGDTPMESIVRECQEEASLGEDVVRERIRQAGVVSYVYRTSPLQEGSGYLQPEVQYIYDLHLPHPSASANSAEKEGMSKFIPKPNDGEAQCFDLLSIPQIMNLLEKGEFKPNCALVMLDFLIRKGVIKEGDKGAEGYIEILQLLHRDLGLPMP